MTAQPAFETDQEIEFYVASDPVNRGSRWIYLGPCDTNYGNSHRSHALKSVEDGRLYVSEHIDWYRKYVPKPVAGEAWNRKASGYPRIIDAVEGDWVIYSHPSDDADERRMARKLADFLESFEKA